MLDGRDGHEARRGLREHGALTRGRTEGQGLREGEESAVADLGEVRHPEREREQGAQDDAQEDRQTRDHGAADLAQERDDQQRGTGEAHVSENGVLAPIGGHGGTARGPT